MPQTIVERKEIQCFECKTIWKEPAKFCLYCGFPLTGTNIASEENRVSLYRVKGYTKRRKEVVSVQVMYCDV